MRLSVVADGDWKMLTFRPVALLQSEGREGDGSGRSGEHIGEKGGWDWDWGADVCDGRRGTLQACKRHASTMTLTGGFLSAAPAPPPGAAGPNDHAHPAAWGPRAAPCYRHTAPLTEVSFSFLNDASFSFFTNFKFILTHQKDLAILEI